MSPSKMQRVARTNACLYADIAPVSPSAQSHPAFVDTCFFVNTNRTIPYPHERHQLFHPAASECSGKPPHTLSNHEFGFRRSSHTSGESSEFIGECIVFDIDIPHHLLCILTRHFTCTTSSKKALQESSSPEITSTHPCIGDYVSFPLA